MITNYLKIALRSLLRQKGFAAVSVFGLALGMACCILLMLQVRHELSYDTFHLNKDRIFRVYSVSNTGESVSASQPLPLAPTLKTEMPQVEYATRITSDAPSSIKYNTVILRESPAFVDADFFRIFTLNFLQGSSEQAFSDLQSAVITKELADKMFGADANALGKAITVKLQGQDRAFIVSGVIDNLPANSSLECSILLRFENCGQYLRDKNVWTNTSTETYITLKDPAMLQDFERNLQPFVNKNFAEAIQSEKDAGIKPNARGNHRELHAQPLGDVNFNTMLDKSKASLKAMYGLVVIAFVILLIATINYVNLSVARSLTRSREVGIRKTIGARRGQIIAQFLGESMLTVALAIVLSVVLAEMLLPLFNTITNAKLSLIIPDGMLANVLFWSGMLLLLMLLGVAAGAYPAFYVSGLATVATIKDRLQGVSPSRLRSILVTVQFALAVFLIAFTFVIQQQTDFMQKKSLGFNRDCVVMIPTGDGANGKAIMERLRSMLAGNSNVMGMSTATKPIGRGLDNSNTNSHIIRNFNAGRVSVDVLNIGIGYLEVLEIPLLAGRRFDNAHFSVDTLESIIVNESAARQIWSLLSAQEQKQHAQDGIFRADAVVGVTLPADEPGAFPMRVIGVTADYHVESMRRKIEPTIHVMWSGYPDSYIFARIRPEHIPEAMAALQSAWQRVSPEVPWQGSFLDENITRMYRNYLRLTKLTLTAASIAITLACVGLFALAAMMIRARTKEIGIRKVLGASVQNIVGLLSGDFLKLVGIAIVLATPFAYWIAEKWLQDFAYKTELRWWMFVLAGIIAVSIAFATVAVQAWRAARANPVQSLRSE